MTPNLKNLPITPGVYIYRDSKGEIIYVGKAINLKKRISQYFQRDDALGPKTQTLVSQIASIETKQVGSEIEALILESSLIKKYKPKYNSMLKDNRSYTYICITKDAIPKVFSAHYSGIDPKNYNYGPFPSGSSVRSLLNSLRHIFPYRSLDLHPKGQCLYCHLGLCPGSSPDHVAYRQQIGKIKKLLSGHFKSLQHDLKKEMKLASKTENYELASKLKNQLESVIYVVSGWHNLNTLFDKVELPEDQSSSAINDLLTVLKPPIKNKISRIECFDISQLGSKYFVGAMTVWQNGFINKSQYRKFKIKTKDTPDDQYMIKEVLWRRFNHPEWGTPDLVVVDGGKPQVTGAQFIFKEKNLNNIILIGLAKKLETIVIKTTDNWVEINLPHSSSGLKLLQSLRDEAHRFANRYRKDLIKKSLNQ